MKVGDYCYIKNLRRYGIGKINSIEDNNNVIISFKDRTHTVSIGNVISSEDIIDLIEVGDYVNGRLVTDIHNDRIYTFNSYTEECKLEKGFAYMLADDIKSIVTKEQFESMEYKVNSND